MCRLTGEVRSTGSPKVSVDEPVHAAQGQRLVKHFGPTDLWGQSDPSTGWHDIEVHLPVYPRCNAVPKGE
jgi:hypothetical protein